MDHDVTVVGAGPVGLCMARALAGAGFTVGLIERRGEESLSSPPFDGRVVALTVRSMDLLEELGVKRHLPAGAISPLLRTKVMNGSSSHCMVVDSALVGSGQLGGLVSHHLIRAAAWTSVRSHEGIHKHIGAAVSATGADATQAWAELENGARITSRLLIAIDGGFSSIRRDRDINADMHDFGKSMVVCRMQHEKPHEHTAWEWFDHGQTLAVLPLAEHHASIVLTVPEAEVRGLMDMDEAGFNAEMERRFQRRLGAMQLESSRHAYPLVAVYARRFVAPRLALAGDAAVGMHPVTAHGFNFGLESVRRLRDALTQAREQGKEPADPDWLEHYERGHRMGTWPLYRITNAFAGLYTDDRAPARLLRAGVLRTGQLVTPFRRALARQIVKDSDH